MIHKTITVQMTKLSSNCSEKIYDFNNFSFDLLKYIINMCSRLTVAAANVQLFTSLVASSKYRATIFIFVSIMTNDG